MGGGGEAEMTRELPDKPAAVCRESHYRSIAKTVSYRVIGTGVTMTVAWVVTGKPTVAAAIGMSDTLIKLATFYFHERAWDRITFGRVKKGEREAQESLP